MFKQLLFLAVVVLSLSSCSKDEAVTNASFDPQATGADYSNVPSTVVTVSNDITTNTTWTNTNVYELDGIIYVKDGATLTIQAGTFIKGVPSGSGSNGTLVITQSGTINAQGTATSPIIFTSYNLLDNNAGTTASSGDYGGVIVLGEATINDVSGTDNVEGLIPSINSQYGGTNDADNSGTIRYTRIEFAGYALSNNNEINGLTLGGVGSGTTLDYIQVSYGDDDSFEFFGGTVNATNLVSFAPADDNFDFDQGYTGSITRALALADVNSEHSGTPPADPDSNGIELDNNSSDFSATPQTLPVISGLSIFGVSSSSDANDYLHGIRVRRGGAIDLSNSVVTGYNIGLFFKTGTGAGDITASTLCDLDLHGFNNAYLPSSLTFCSFPPSNFSTGSPAGDFGHSQPFFNDGTLNFSGASGGAFSNGTGWIANWTKFDNF